MRKPSNCRSGRAARVFAILFALSFALFACGSSTGTAGERLADAELPVADAPAEGGAGDEAPSQDESEQPVEPEQPAEPEQPVEAEPDSGGDVEVGVVPADDADDNASTVLVAVLIVAFVVVLIVAFSLAGRRSKPTTAATRPVSTISPRRQLLGNVQWLHDQLSLELLSAPGEAAAQRWLTERPRVDSMAIACQQTAAAGGGPEWQQLAARISGVARSLDTAIALRADPAADPTLVHEAIDAVNRNRANLMRSAQTANQSA